MRRKIKWGRILILCIIPILCIGLGSIFVIHLFQKPQQEVVEEKKSYYDLNLFTLKNGLMTYKDSSYTTSTGIDVSDHNGDIDWVSVKADGIDFAMLRIGYRGAQEGVLHEDANFEKNILQAQKNGLKVGAYFFSSAINAEEIDEEVQFVLKKVSSYSIDLPIVFDMEEFDQGGRIDDLSTKKKTNLALRFCKEIKEAGYTPMIYGNMTWLYENYNFDKISKYPIWLASYTTTCPMEDDFDMWQYTNRGQVNGIEGDVDINIYLQKK